MRQDKTNTESNGDKRGPEYRKGSFLRLKRKKEGESAFSDFIGFYFIYRIVGICGFYPGIGRIIHPRLALMRPFFREAQNTSGGRELQSTWCAYGVWCAYKHSGAHIICLIADWVTKTNRLNRNKNSFRRVMRRQRSHFG
jgi:hypothetical protein